MKSDSESVRVAARIPEGEGERYCATREEVEQALYALSDADYVKLELIARSFCRRRKLTPNVMEPNELLSESMLATLQMYKKWNKRVSIVRHLDRAMENVSSRIARERNRIVPFPETSGPDYAGGGEENVEPPPDDALASKEEAERLLKEIFGNDTEGNRIFTLRAGGMQAHEIQAMLKLSDQEYETVTRRIRRKISNYSTQLKK